MSRDSEQHLSTIPMGRQATVQDIANARLFVASDESAYITADRLNVVGGGYMVYLSPPSQPSPSTEEGISLSLFTEES